MREKKLYKYICISPLQHLYTYTQFNIAITSVIINFTFNPSLMDLYWQHTVTDLVISPWLTINNRWNQINSETDAYQIYFFSFSLCSFRVTDAYHVYSGWLLIRYNFIRFLLNGQNILANVVLSYLMCLDIIPPKVRIYLY